MPSPHSLADWLALLENRHPVAIELGLDRVAEVAARLRLARPAPLVISVAGTNGKGSCVAMLEALLRQAGVRVGTYTSPHLVRYNERVRIDGSEVTDAALCAAFARIEAARGDVRLTYFETGTLAALLLFGAAEVEVAVLEVGMGGRLDAVNLIDPDIAVITSIDLDHQAWLGHDRDAIGVEKAGIARPGVITVCGDPNPPPAMLAALSALGSPTLLLGHDGFALGSTETGLELHCVAVDGTPHRYPGLPSPQLPPGSAACAVQALVILGRPPEPTQVTSAFRHTGLAGRFQQLTWQGRQLILDVAHNPAAATLLAARLTALKLPADRIHGVVGALADKDLAGLLGPLVSTVGHWHCCDLPGVGRAATATSLAAVLYNAAEVATAEVRGDDQDSIRAVGCHPDPATGLAAAIECSLSGDLILVFGSFHTLAPVLAELAPVLAELAPMLAELTDGTGEGESHE